MLSYSNRLHLTIFYSFGFICPCRCRFAFKNPATTLHMWSGVSLSVICASQLLGWTFSSQAAGKRDRATIKKRIKILIQERFVFFFPFILFHSYNMIARTSLKTLYNRKTIGKLARLPACDKKQQKRGSSSSSCNDNSKDNKDKKQQMTKSTTQKKTRAPDIPSFMPVVNIPVAELAHNAFYSLHRPLLGLSTPRPFLAGNMVGQIQKEEDNNECK